MVSRAVFLASILSVALFAGCSHHSGNKTVTATTTRETTSEPPEHDACSLLDPKEVEAVLGAPLATPPYAAQGGSPSDGGEDCIYQDANFHKIVVDVTWEGGPQVWKMYGMLQSAVDQNAKGILHLADGSDIAGEWDEARVLNCCKFMALRGDQIVNVDIGGTTAVSIAQAAKLADAALKRLEKPLPIDGSQGVEPARAYATAHRPKRIDPCALLTRAEAEAIMGPLTGDPSSKGDTCTYPRAPEGHIGMDVELKVQWKGGFDDFRESGSIIKTFAKGFPASIGGLPDWEKKSVEKGLAGPAPTANPAWEASGPTVARGYCAVKKDVMVSVDSLGLKHEDIEKVLAQVMSKI